MRSYPAGVTSAGVGIGDLDNDGDLDLVVAAPLFEGTSKLELMRNTAGGAATSTATGIRT